MQVLGRLVFFVPFVLAIPGTGQPSLSSPALQEGLRPECRTCGRSGDNGCPEKLSIHCTPSGANARSEAGTPNPFKNTGTPPASCNAVAFLTFRVRLTDRTFIRLCSSLILEVIETAHYRGRHERREHG